MTDCRMGFLPCNGKTEATRKVQGDRILGGG